MQNTVHVLDARITAEMLTTASLDEVCRWLIAANADPLRFERRDVPSAGTSTVLRLGRPITGPRAVLSSLWLVEDVDEGECLLAGQLRFVSHPTTSDVKVNFSGRSASGLAAGPVLQSITRSIEGRPALRLVSADLLAFDETLGSPEQV